MSSVQEQKWCIGCWAKLDSELQTCKRCGRRFIASDRSSYYCRPVGYLSGLDLHVVYLSLMISLLGIVVPWPALSAIISFLIPQPMIVTHLVDRYHHKSDERKWNTNYIIVNEAFVAFLALATFAISAHIRR
jgi:hypothetical protein